VSHGVQPVMRTGPSRVWVSDYGREEFEKAHAVLVVVDPMQALLRQDPESNNKLSSSTPVLQCPPNPPLQLV
jgi:hypothetical protein